MRGHRKGPRLQRALRIGLQSSGEERKDGRSQAFSSQVSSRRLQGGRASGGVALPTALQARQSALGSLEEHAQSPPDSGQAHPTAATGNGCRFLGQPRGPPPSGGLGGPLCDRAKGCCGLHPPVPQSATAHRSGWPGPPLPRGPSLSTFLPSRTPGCRVPPPPHRTHRRGCLRSLAGTDAEDAPM